MVLGATAALFWFARRDLAARAAPPTHGTEELEQLCTTLEALVTDLSQRLTALEQQEPCPARALPLSPPSGPANAEQRREELEPSANSQYASVYALIDAGITDAQEVACRTGLSRGEVDLILGLRARQIL